MPSLSDDEDVTLPLPVNSPPMNSDPRKRSTQSQSMHAAADASMPNGYADKPASTRSVPMHFENSKWQKLIPPTKRTRSKWSTIVRVVAHSSRTHVRSVISGNFVKKIEIRRL